MTPGRLQQQARDHRVQALEANLALRYGPLLTTQEVAEVLRYRSPQAVLKARMRGNLPVPMTRLPSRRGWFMSSHALAKYLAGVELLPAAARDDNQDSRAIAQAAAMDAPAHERHCTARSASAEAALKETHTNQESGIPLGART